VTQARAGIGGQTGWSASARAAQAAGRAIDFVRIDPATGHCQAKNEGFAATDPARCDYVCFADADGQPAPDWLAQLLAPFGSAAPPAAVAGRTSYAPTVAGAALTTIDVRYFPGPLQARAMRNFYANNVVFRRALVVQSAGAQWPGFAAHARRAPRRRAGTDRRLLGRGHARCARARHGRGQGRWKPRGRMNAPLPPHLARISNGRAALALDWLLIGAAFRIELCVYERMERLGAALSVL
jgi:glycosyltransferase involved in cell wall biosynthesis